MNAETPLMILSGNSIRACHDDAGRDEGARAGGARLGRLFADVGDHGKLKHVFGIAKPKMIFAEQGPIYARALAALAARRRRGRDRDADPRSSRRLLMTI